LSIGRRLAVWAGVTLAVGVPVWAAAQSPYLAYRQPVYILGGFAGIFGLALLFLQPLLALGLLPGLEGRRGRFVHRLVGAGLLLAVIVHVAGLWITSPPDVVDALTFTSPTPFSAWGVVAMWAVFATTALALSRRRLGLAPRRWKLWHGTFAVIVVTGTVVHAMLIEGAMEPVTKALLCALAVVATVRAVAGLFGRGTRRA